MKILKQIIRFIQYILALLMIFAFGKWILDKAFSMLSIESNPAKLLIISFVLYLILVGVSYLFKEKE